MKRVLFGLVTLAIGVSAVVHDPMVSTEALAQGAQSAAAVAILMSAALGGGALLARAALREAPGGENPEPVDWVVALVMGLLAIGLGELLLAAIFGVGPASLGIPVLLVGAGWLRRSPFTTPTPSAATLVVAGIAGSMGAVTAFAPPTNTDELYQHLALPTRMLTEGTLVGGLFHPDGSRPLLLHLPFTALMQAAGDTAPRLLCVGLAIAVLFATEDTVRRLARNTPELATAAPLAPLVLVGSWTFLQDMGVAANNLATALAVLAAFHSARAGQWRWLALTAGAALSYKYTAAGVIAGIYLVSALPWRLRVLAGVLALAVVAPWWLRNLADGLHPLFPYAGWSSLAHDAVPEALQFQYLEKYGAGRAPLDFLALPYTAVLTADPGSFRFLGRITPTLLVLAAASLWGAMRHPHARPALLASLFGCIGWALGPQWLRHLLPTLPLLAAALTYAAANAMRPHTRLLLLGFGSVWLAGLPSNVAPHVEDVAGKLDVALGTETKAHFLHRSVRSAEALDWANAHLPPDARVALLYEWSSHLLQRATVLGSVEDHVPTRFWLLTHGDASIRDLSAAGVTHLVVGRFSFLRKWYPFLDDTVYDSMFAAPTTELERLLLRDAILIHEAGRVRIYRIEFEGAAP